MLCFSIMYRGGVVQIHTATYRALTITSASIHVCVGLYNMLDASYLRGSELISCWQSQSHIVPYCHFHWREVRGRRGVRGCAVTHSEPLQNLSVTHVHWLARLGTCLKYFVHFQAQEFSHGGWFLWLYPKFEVETTLTWYFIDGGKDRSAGGWVVGRAPRLFVEPEGKGAGWRVGCLAETQHLCCTGLHGQVQESCREMVNFDDFVWQPPEVKLIRVTLPDTTGIGHSCVSVLLQ